MSRRKRTTPPVRTFRLCAATMIGPTEEDAAAYEEAAASVREIVDGYVTTHPGEITDFSKARNDLLRAAAEEGYDWALMLDADERVSCLSRSKLDRALSDTTTTIFAVQDQYGVITKERLFHLPASGEYRGATHEAFVPAPGITRVLVPATVISTWELVKTEAQIARKASRDIAILETSLEHNPEDARSWLFLGHSHALSRNFDAARSAYERCFNLYEDEEAAFAAWFIALMFAQEDRFAEALPWCLLGMERHAGIAELPCLAGACSYGLGKPQQALRWFHIAKAFGCLGDLELDNQPIHRRDPHARWEQPYGVTREILRELGAPASRIARETRGFERACQSRRANYPNSSAWSA